VPDVVDPDEIEGVGQRENDFDEVDRNRRHPQ
jgi:hypothetical protein